MGLVISVWPARASELLDAFGHSEGIDEESDSLPEGVRLMGPIGRAISFVASVLGSGWLGSTITTPFSSGSLLVALLFRCQKRGTVVS